jgi:hypothetical protein
MKKIIIGLMTLTSASVFAQTIEVIDLSKGLTSGLYVSYKSNEDGTCIHLGYDKALKNSKVKYYKSVRVGNRRTSWDGHPVMAEAWEDQVVIGDSVVFDKNGIPVKQMESKAMEKITCIKH